MEPQDLDAQIAQELEDRGYEVTPEAIQKIKSRLSGQTSPGRRVQRLAPPPPPPPPPPPAEETPASTAAPQDEGFGEKFGDAVDALQGGFAQITGSGFRAADTAARKLGATFAGVPYEQVRRGVGGYGGAFADAAEYFREVEEANRLSEADEENYVNQVARGIGQAAGFSVAGIAGGPGIGGAAAIGGYGAATQSNDAYWRILDKTKDEEKAWQGASLNAIAGASESFGAFIPGARALGSILFRMDKSTGGALKKALLPSMAGGMLKGGLAEAGQEMFQGSAEIAIDRYLDVYPEDRRTIMQVAKDVYQTQGAPAFGVGAVLAPLGIAAERADMRARERANREERVERPEAPEREMSPESTAFFEQLKRRGARRVVETPDEFKPQEEAARRRGLRLYAIETDPDTAISGVERSGSGDIFININRRDEAVRGAIDHEVDHKLEVMDPEGYAAKAKIIEETEPELLQQKMLEVKERYSREGVELSDDNAKREAIALLMETEVFPFTEAFRSDPKLVEEFLTDDRNAFKKVLEATMDVMNEMGAGFDTRRARLGKLLERVNAIEGRIKPESAARIAQEYVRSMQSLEALETGRAESEQAAQRKAAEDRARARAEARAAAAAGREAAPAAAPAAAPTPPKPTAPKPTDLISVEEAAGLLGVSPAELVGLRDDGVLRSQGTDAEGRMVFSKAEVESALSTLSAEVLPEPSAASLAAAPEVAAPEARLTDSEREATVAPIRAEMERRLERERQARAEGEARAESPFVQAQRQVDEMNVAQDRLNAASVQRDAALNELASIRRQARGRKSFQPQIAEAQRRVIEAQRNYVAAEKALQAPKGAVESTVLIGEEVIVKGARGRVVDVTGSAGRQRVDVQFDGVAPISDIPASFYNQPIGLPEQSRPGGNRGVYDIRNVQRVAAERPEFERTPQQRRAFKEQFGGEAPRFSFMDKQRQPWQSPEFDRWQIGYGKVATQVSQSYNWAQDDRSHGNDYLPDAADQVAIEMFGVDGLAVLQGKKKADLDTRKAMNARVKEFEWKAENRANELYRNTELTDAEVSYQASRALGLINKAKERGEIPKSARSVSELSDYVDANAFFTSPRIGDLGRKLGWKVNDYVNFTNRVQEEVDKNLSRPVEGQAPEARFSLTSSKERDLKFRELQDMQRDNPESMYMEEINPGAENSAQFQWAMEHTGDLIHRAAYPSEGSGWGGGSWQYGIGAVREKAEKLYKSVSDISKSRERAEKNWEYRNSLGKTSLSKTEYVNQMGMAGRRYSEAYRVLPAYTKLQQISKDAAIALGEQRWSDYADALKSILDTVKLGKEGYFEPLTDDQAYSGAPTTSMSGQAPEARFSLGERSTAQRDRDYLSAVAAGDMETAQRMVDEAGSLEIELMRGSKDFMEVAKQVDGLPPDAIIRVFTATDKSTAEMFLSSGVDEAKKPTNLTKSFQPGRGLDRGLYVGDAPVAVEGYGRYILAIEIPKSRLEPSSEAMSLNYNTPGLALGNSANGAIVRGSIDPKQISLWTGGPYERPPLKIRLPGTEATVTYDDAGNVIPLSQRFGGSPDIRYSLGERNITQRDRAYLSAVAAGDMETAQSMVDEAANAAGYGIGPVYHGLASGKLEGNAFDPQRLGSNTGSEDAKEGFYFSTRGTAEGYAKKPIRDKALDTLDSFAKFENVGFEPMRYFRSLILQGVDAREAVERGFGVALSRIDVEYNKALYSEVGPSQRAAVAKAEKQRADLKSLMNSFESLYSERGGRDAETVKAFLRMRNPYVIDAKHNWVNRLKIIRTAKKRGHDGAIIYDAQDGGLADLYIVFAPNQIKSADPVTRDDAGNVIPLSQRFGESPDIRYSFTDAGIRQSAQDGIRFSFAPWREMSDWLDGTSWWPKGLEDFRNKYVDYLSTTKRLVSQAARKPAEMVPAMSRTIRRRGLAKTRIEQISDPLVRKFEKRAKELGVKIDDVADFMRARVAPLANARVDTVERRDPDAYYSGVTDAEALAIINRLKADPAYYKKLVEVVKIVDEMNELRLDIDVRSGRLKAEDAKAMRETYSPAALAAMDPTYKNEEGFKTLYGSLQSIPEKSVIDEGLVDTPGVGRGLGKSGAPAKARTGTKKGSNRQLANPVVNAMMALQAAVVREVKAQEQRSWRDFVASVGDPTFGVVMDTVPTKRVLGSDGYVHVIPDPNWSARPGVLPFLENGEWKAIVFKDDNRLIAEDLKALTVGAPIEGVAQITRGMSQLLTRYDPTFFLRNVPRDFGWAIMAGGVRYGYKFSRQMASNWPSATREIFRNKFRGAAATGYYKEYLESGAETSMIPFRDYNQSLRDLRKAVESRDGTQFFQAYEKYIGGANDVFEAATRYAVFKTARLQGKTVEEAAIMAKEGAGLNFEQTGRYGRRINSLYAFFNAGINGTDQLLRLINPKNPDKEARVRAAQAVAAVVGVGIVQEILNRSFSDEGEDGEKEYDNISNFEKNRNMVFMLPEGGYLKAPLPFGFNAIYALGRNIAAYSMGAVSAAEASTDAVTFFMESGSPLGSGPITQVLTPTMFEPIVQVATNQSFTGAKIAPDLDTFGRQLKAPHDLYWKNTPEAPKEIARLLAEATEKGDSGRGYIDIRPDIIEHIMAAYAGGIGQRAIEATDNLASLVKGDVPEARQTFGLRHFVGQASPYAIDKRYSDNRDEIEMVKARYEELVKAGDKETAKAWLDANGPLAKSYQALRGTERMLDQIPNTPENEERRRSVKARFTRTLSQLKASPQ